MRKPQKVLWTPTQDFINNSNLKKFENWLTEHRGLYFKTYEEFWQWSIDEIEEFWKALWQYFNIIHDHPYLKILSGHQMPGVEWFSGATLNYAQHIFRNKSTDHPALIFYNEMGKRVISWVKLEKEVKAFQSFLIANGIRKGDVVAGYLPNIPEAISCFLAVNSIGAVWTCCSPDFGESTVVERFGQTQPTLLIATDGYSYNGKGHNRLQSVHNIRKSIKSIDKTVLISYLDPKAELAETMSWTAILNSHTSSEPLAFAAVPFSHPIWVLYSSGTTGKPKAITHSHGGVLLEHLKYMTFHNDVKCGEHFFWFTTTGWMMWNFLQASMLVGAVPVLYDGSPGYPSLDSLWQLAEELPIHHFGTSAPFLTACMKGKVDLRERDLSNLRSIGSTGAPLPSEVFDWVYKYVAEDVWLCSMSGGTDVCTAFVGGNPYLPVYQGFIQSRALGCALYAYDEHGEHVQGSLGEMVIEKPMPSMPIYFWNDENNIRYQNSYFEKFSGKWRHGDWIDIEPNGSLIIQGRSDATLNRQGIRIGTAEIYSILDKIPVIKDSLIINLERANGEDVMPLFVILENNKELTNDIKDIINKELRMKCSPRHVPTEIIAVPDIPYTLSGKKMEVPVKKLLMKMTTNKDMNRDAIRNPEAMDYFVEHCDAFIR